MNDVMSMNSRRSFHSQASLNSLNLVDKDFTRGADDTLRSRVLSSVSTWLDKKVAESPGCVERFVCESFKTGETLDGPSYFLMAVSNAAVSYTLAEQFSDVMELRGLQSAARMGRARDS